jgi:hypothetical protein
MLAKKKLPVVRVNHYEILKNIFIFVFKIYWMLMLFKRETTLAFAKILSFLIASHCFVLG